MRDVDPVLARAQGSQDHAADVLGRVRDEAGRESARGVELGVGDRRQQQGDLVLSLASSMRPTWLSQFTAVLVAE